MFFSVTPRAAIITLCCVGLSMGVAAQPPSSISFSASPLYQFDSDLERGGQSGYSALLMALGASWTLGSGARIGLQLRLDEQDWRFRDPVAFLGVAPWNRITQVGVSLPYAVTSADGWRLNLTPTIEYAGESGARFSDALEYGATVSAAKRLRPDLTLGLGVGVFSKIEETSAFPFVVVDWNITERVRLTNPFPAGPAGPAGLQLSYAFDAGWSAGVGAAYRSNRFRLDKNGPVANGIGEHRFIPVYIQLARDLSERLRLDLYAGVSTATRLRVEDHRGRKLIEEDQDPAPMLGITLSGRF
ncbi:hypothetical protein CKO25_12765 [Thiocapsa imhoffii]|uniref:DUF6268 domain-containing protein n=1 Tax=Thiocapsa imhoffii TaxID=382777 RepID=A0A9X1B919_9GAMM|nr:DUF6268 family outer membrane beta-barrel protein [Thiocapsa imhoffii]MBK1645499.1 hypothetical protein [Thiocapsa imhoffii]